METTIHWTATRQPDGSLAPGYTFNPWWGCQRWSEGCIHCYAESLSKRWGKHIWGSPAVTERQPMSEAYWRNPLKWNKLAQTYASGRLKVFCGSMCDWAEDAPLLDIVRGRLFATIKATPNLDWLLLTKRADNILNCLPEDWGKGYPNVWLGVSVENQKRADERIPELMKVPASKRFLSVEPLLEEINLRRYLIAGWNKFAPLINWVIVGGESGPGHRPFEAQWARTLRDDCKACGTAFFFKQHGGTKKIDGVWGGDKLDGVQHYNWPESVKP